MQGERIAQLREAAGLTQAELAERLGKSRRTIQLWEAEGVPMVRLSLVRAAFGLEDDPVEPEEIPGPDATVGRLLDEHGLPSVLAAIAREAAKRAYE